MILGLCCPDPALEALSPLQYLHPTACILGPLQKSDQRPLVAYVVFFVSHLLPPLGTPVHQED